MTIGWVAAGATHVGRVRKGNEDSFRLDSRAGIFIVADGMGGHAAGEIASQLAADAALEVLTASTPGQATEQRLVAAFAEAHRKIVTCCDDDPETKGMGTTLTVAVLEPNGSLHVGHIGDSRLYRFTGEQLRQVTKDHTWVQKEVDAGRLRSDQTRAHALSHILTRVLSSDEPDTPDVESATVKPGDVLLLCTDGLHNMLEGQKILEILNQPLPPTELAQRLITSANRSGGLDNITAVVIRISSDSE